MAGPAVFAFRQAYLLLLPFEKDKQRRAQCTFRGRPREGPFFCSRRDREEGRCLRCKLCRPNRSRSRGGSGVFFIFNRRSQRKRSGSSTTDERGERGFGDFLHKETKGTKRMGRIGSMDFMNGWSVCSRVLTGILNLI